MRLVVDASTLVAEVLRARGRKLLTHPALDLALAEETWGETEHELRKRVALLVDREIFLPALATQILDEALATVAARVTLVSPDVYADRMEEARRRLPRDPDDAPVVALALGLNCGIWTGDRDFFGCGVAVWVTETLMAHLEAQGMAAILE
jgi:predicted nucleic acid-binding protein